MGQKLNIFCKLSFVILSWLFLHCLYITYDGLRPFRGRADIAIVLGTSVFEDGRITPWLQGRTEEARQLYLQKRVRKIMVSGGQEKDRRPEGDVMKEYLVANGVNPNDIIVDNKGINTYCTARNFLQLNQQCHYRSAVVVTSFYHVPRSKYIMKKLGYENVYGDHSMSFFWKDAQGLVRDCIAFYKYMIVY